MADGSRSSDPTLEGTTDRTSRNTDGTTRIFAQQPTRSGKPTSLGSRSSADGFTLLEVLVVISIFGVLMSMLLPAVQAARESGRRTQCLNQLRQQALALQNYHAVHRHFPAGRVAFNGLNHSWSSAILPFLEQGHLAEEFDFGLRWDAGRNERISRTVLPVYRCPTSILDLEGDTDYGGMKGSILSGTSSSHSLGGLFGSGILIDVSRKSGRPVSIADVLDGNSQTIIVAEASDRFPSEHGLWADGFNCLSHDNGQINRENSGEIFSLHPGGANVAFADGSVHFLTEDIPRRVIGALCTRAGGETLTGDEW